ncbi:RCC1 domain-containing protein [Thermomonospora umbrina]|nr:hypothetical protein [Thermomonospora umbrina]
MFRTGVAGLAVAAGTAGLTGLSGPAHAVASTLYVENVPGHLAGGQYHSLLISDLAQDGVNEVYATGDNGYGQLGNNTSGGQSTTLVKVHSLSGVKNVSAGGAHSVAVKADGTVWAWGLNDKGQLGNGTTVDSKVPVKVPGIANAVAAVAGESSVLVILSNGTAKSWGQLNASCAASTTPVTVAGLTGIATKVGAAAVGWRHAVVALADGTAKAWGDNNSGQLGTGNTTGSCSPVTVAGLTGVTQVSAKGSHTLARISTGTAKAWGSNHGGQVGIGTTNPTTVLSPTTVPGLTGVASVSAGYVHSMAVTDSGSTPALKVWSWGSGAFGQLGTGSTSISTSPVAAAGTNITGTILEAGYYHVLTTNASQIPEAWGMGGSGQLGTGDENQRNTRTDILSPEPLR